MNRALALAVLSAVCLAACHSSERTPTASNPAPTPSGGATLLKSWIV
jgi:hypothetical protein